jgi:hypothetical protein
MMALSALTEAAGLFDWLAVHAAQLAGWSATRLFLNVFLLGNLISMILSNDATAPIHSLLHFPSTLMAPCETRRLTPHDDSLRGSAEVGTFGRAELQCDDEPYSRLGNAHLNIESLKSD